MTNIAAIIPARGGSKSIPKKNLCLLGNETLLARAIAVARQVSAVQRVIVSTDDEDIAGAARESGAEALMRPAHLSGDAALVIDAVRHVIEELYRGGWDPELGVLLEPTCPLRRPADVQVCLDALLESPGRYDTAATFSPAKLNPMRAWRINDQGEPRSFIEGANPWLPRQKLPDAYQLNGAVYAFRVSYIMQKEARFISSKAKAVLIPGDRSIDIDDPFDLRMAELMIQGKEKSCEN